MDNKDKFEYHLFFEDNEDIVAVLRILFEKISHDEMAMGMLAVKKSYRKPDISKIMADKAIQFIIGT